MSASTSETLSANNNTKHNQKHTKPKEKKYRTKLYVTKIKTI